VARTTDVRLGDRELEDARWFHRDELLGGSMMPFPQSIAYRLIHEWLSP
jgi:NADH pyrophosphatase NudC (nudix superfamily)